MKKMKKITSYLCLSLLLWGCLTALATCFLFRNFDEVPVKSENICSVYGGNNQKDSLYFGAILPLSEGSGEENIGIASDLGQPLAEAMKIAIDEINALPFEVMPGHKIRMILCDSQANNDQAIKAARFLADWKVPAIIGPALSSIAKSVAEEVTIPERIVLLSPSATSSSLSYLNDSIVRPDNSNEKTKPPFFSFWGNKKSTFPMVYRTVPHDEQSGAAMAAFISQLKQQKIFLISKKGRYGEDLGRSVNHHLNRLNTDKTMEIQPFEYTLSSKGEVKEHSQLKKKFEDFTPEVVVMLGTSEVVNLLSNLVTNISDKEKKKILWVLSAKARTRRLSEFLTNEPEICRRLQGVAFSETGNKNYLNFRHIFLAKNHQYSEPPIFSASAYDGVYSLIYAFAGAYREGKTRFDGESIARFFQNISSKEKQIVVNIGQDGFPHGLKALQSGKQIVLKGASSHTIAFDQSGNLLNEDVQRGGEGQTSISYWWPDCQLDCQKKCKNNNFVSIPIKMSKKGVLPFSDLRSPIFEKWRKLFTKQAYSKSLIFLKKGLFLTEYIHNINDFYSFHESADDTLWEELRLDLIRLGISLDAEDSSLPKSQSTYNLTNAAHTYSKAGFRFLTQEKNSAAMQAFLMVYYLTDRWMNQASSIEVELAKCYEKIAQDEKAAGKTENMEDKLDMAIQHITDYISKIQGTEFIEKYPEQLKKAEDFLKQLNTKSASIKPEVSAISSLRLK